MKLVNLAKFILMVSTVVSISCSDDNGSGDGDGQQAANDELEQQLLDTRWKLVRQTKVQNGTETTRNNSHISDIIAFSGKTNRAWHYLYLNDVHSGWWWIGDGMILCQWDTGDPKTNGAYSTAFGFGHSRIGKMTDSELVMIADYDTHCDHFYYVTASGEGSNPGTDPSAEKPEIGFYDFTATKTSVAVTYKIYNKDEAKVSGATIYYGTSSNPTTSKNASVNGTLINATISGLKAGTTYYVKCRATGAGGTTTSETTKVITAY